MAGPPITQPSYFFGREREFKRLFNLLKRRPLQNAAIIGARRSGKTSLLNCLRQITVTPREQLRPNQRLDWLPAPAQYRWILVDFQDSRFSSRARLLGYILDQLNLSVPEPCDLEQFLDVVSQELARPTVIMFDEIGVALQRYSELDDSFWEGLRALATNQVGGNLAFVLAPA
jgi:predicted AAA+ superfamily ATPase